MENHRRINHKVRVQSRRNQRVTIATILLLIASASGILTYSVLNQSSYSSSSQTVSFKAAVVDQLSETFPNPSFNDNAKTILAGAGYTVDYYRPDQVTVDLFRTLPSKNYNVVIIRAHSTGYNPLYGERITIFTSEVYSPNQHVYEQLTDQVGRATLGTVGQAESGQVPAYFSITPLFVRDSMQGNFPNSIIIMMGCTGLENSDMAQAFVSKGARVYVSWDRSVTSDRTDIATIALLRSLTQGKTLGQAVSAAMDQVGPDPIYTSQLGYYPDNQATLVLGLQHNAMMANVQGAGALPIKLVRSRVLSGTCSG